MKTIEKLKEKMFRLRTDGLTYRQIQKELGISSLSVIHHHLKAMSFEKVSRKQLKEAVVYLQKENKALLKKLNKINNIIHG